MQEARARPTILVSAIWEDRGSSTPTGKLRTLLKHQCKSSQGKCHFSSTSEILHAHQENGVCQKVDAGWSMNCSLTALLRRSVFSLQPTGDSFGRRGIYDALSQGAIPVIFDNRSFFMPWHAPNAQDFSVLIDLKVILDAVAPRSVIDILAAIPSTEVARLQHNIARAGMRMHYASPPPDANGCVLDAYEVIMQNMCRRAARKPVRLKDVLITAERGLYHPRAKFG